MSLEIQKENNENSQGLSRRFSKRMKMSGILMRARRKRFYHRTKSEATKKKSALRREEIRKEYELKEKMGKAEEKRRY